MNIITGTLYGFIDEDRYDEIKTTLSNGTMLERLRELKRIKAAGLDIEALRDLLSPVLASDDIRLVSVAVKILHDSGDATAVDHLFQFLDGAYSNNVKVRAIKAIEACDTVLFQERLHSYLYQGQEPKIMLALLEGSVDDENDYFFDIGAEFVNQIFASNHLSLKLSLLTILERGGEKAVPLIIIALDDAESIVVQAAFSALARIGGPAAIQVIRSYVQNENKEIVYHAAFALALLGEPSYFRFIKRDLADEDPEKQLFALRFLKSKAGFGGEEYFDDVIKRLSNHAVDDAVKKAAQDYITLYGEISARNTVPEQEVRQ